jgi:hypothetical protein
VNRDSRPATTLLENPVIGGTARTGRPACAHGGPHGSPGLRLRMARRRCADERTGRRQERLVGAGKPHGSRGSHADPPVPDRTDPEMSARRIPLTGGAAGRSMRGGSRRRRSLQRFGMKCFGGERPGASGRTSADVCARSYGPRAIRRHGVSHLLFLRAGGAETLMAMDREAAPPRQRGGVTARWPKRPRNGEGTPWTAAALVAAKRAGRKPSRR